MDIKKEVLNQFGKHAESYVNSELHAKGNDLKLMVELSGANSEAILLDIATGGGHVANALAPLVKKVIAYDITPEILLQAKNFITKNGQSQELKEELQQRMIGSTEKIKNYFKIKITESSVTEFFGESVLIKAKRNF